jgi:hypothetical protein
MSAMTSLSSVPSVGGGVCGSLGDCGFSVRLRRKDALNVAPVGGVGGAVERGGGIVRFARSE